MSTNDTRKSQLLSLKLRALVRDHLGYESESGLVPDVFARGAAVVEGDVAWVFVDDRPERGLGPALLWSLKEGHRALNVLAERCTGILARQAALFTTPITVWYVDGRTLMPAIAEPYEPAADPSAAHLSFIELIERGGATPVVEHGVVAGEVLGLEVCRAVDDPVTGAARLEVGMGAHDREAFALLHGDRPTVEALADVVSHVRRHRTPDAEAHPFNRIAPERLLRSTALADPSLVGAASLMVCEPPITRSNVLDIAPCVARGLSNEGDDLVVVFTSGADPDIVPFALDARARIDHLGETSSHLVIAMPGSHVTPTNRRALALAVAPRGRRAEFVAVDPPSMPSS